MTQADFPEPDKAAEALTPVYVVVGGTVYHRTKLCYRLWRKANLRRVSVAEALQSGRLPCTCCRPPG